jgi:hypothetical protein
VCVGALKKCCTQFFDVFKAYFNNFFNVFVKSFAAERCCIEKKIQDFKEVNFVCWLEYTLQATSNIK